MKKKRYTEAQIAFALRQAESGTPVFCFVSKLSVDLTEATKDALILFREAAMHALMNRRCLIDDFIADDPPNEPCKPPVYLNGQWCSSDDETSINPMDDSSIMEPVQSIDRGNNGDDEDEDDNPDDSTAITRDDGRLILDEQRFTARSNGHVYAL